MALGLAGFLAWVSLLFALGIGALAAGAVLPFEAGVWLLIVGLLIVLFATSQAFVFFSVTPEPPKGRAMRPSEAPALQALLEALRRELRCRPFDDVRITMDFNAGIREVPRLGFLGWPRTILEIGLPLMEGLNAEELKAVLAHEMRTTRPATRGAAAGSIGSTGSGRRCSIGWSGRPPAGSTGRFARRPGGSRRGTGRGSTRGRWCCRGRTSIMPIGSPPVARAQAAAVSALWRMECLRPMLAERFWVEIFRGAEDSPDPPADITDRMRAACATAPAAEDASRGGTRPEPHHRQRRNPPGVSGSPAVAGRFGGRGPPVGLAAHAVLGRGVAARRGSGRDRGRSVGPVAPERHGRLAPAASPGDGRGPAARGGRLGPGIHACPAARRRGRRLGGARVSFELKGPGAAEPLLPRRAQAHPGHAAAGLVLGGHLLNLGDPEGRRLLEQVAAGSDEFWMRQACQALHDHFKATGQEAELAGDSHAARPPGGGLCRGPARTLDYPSR